MLSLGTASMAVVLMQAEASQVSKDANDWPMFTNTPDGARFNAGESVLSPTTVHGLTLKWKLTLPGPVNGTPAVVDNVIYVGDGVSAGTNRYGHVYAVSDAGQILWSTPTEGPITASALVTKKMVVIGDLKGWVYGLDRPTGAIIWKIRPESHPYATIYSSATMMGNKVVIGISSEEEAVSLATHGTYTPTFRGSVVVLDPEKGDIKAKTYTISDEDALQGATGAAVWSTPTYDKALDLIFVTTGNNYNLPATRTSDAVMALDGHTLDMVWSVQLTEADTWNASRPLTAAEPDFDFGDSANVFSLSDGRRVVGAGQKSGFFHIFDAKTGQQLSHSQIESAGGVGGLFADSAFAYGSIYANGIDWPDFYRANPFLHLPTGGHLIKMSAAGNLQCQYTNGETNMSGVAVANGVVYFQSSLMSSKLYALNASNCSLLYKYDIGGFAASGPAISNGRVYFGTGIYGFGPSGALVSLGLP